MTPAPDPPKRDRSTFWGGSWTLASRIFVQVIQFSIFVLATHYMSPAEFSVFALVAAFVVILAQLSSAGWPEYIMQWQGEPVRLRQTVFVAAAFGVIIALLGIAASLSIDWFERTPDARQVAQILSISVVFTSVGAAYAGVLNWQDQLTASAFCTILSELVSLMVTVGMLLKGFGVVSLAYGRLASSIIWISSSALASRLIPTCLVPATVVRELFDFSRHLILLRIFFNLRIYAATFIIGGFIGAAAVGYFRAAQRIASGLEEIIGEPTRVLAWNLFRKSRNTHGGTEGFDSLSQDFYKLHLYVSVPLFTGTAILADDLVACLLGPDWSTTAPIFQILAIAAMVRVTGHATVPLLTLAGRTALLPKITLVYAVITVILILIAAQFGIVATALADLLAAVVTFGIGAVIIRRHANVHWGTILRESWRVWPALATALAIPLLSYRFDLVLSLPPGLRFAMLSMVIFVVFVASVFVLDPSVRARLKAMRSPAR